MDLTMHDYGVVLPEGSLGIHVGYIDVHVHVYIYKVYQILSSFMEEF